MRLFVCTALLGAASVLAAPVGEKQSSPNTLSAREIADGWVLLFDGETPFGWKTEGDVKVEKGTIVLGGEKPAKVQTTTSFGAFELNMETRLDGGKGGYTISYADGAAKTQEDAASPGDAFVPSSLKHPVAQNAGPLVIQTDPGTRLALRSVKLRPLGTQPIFNGKDLTGWKEIPGHKSKYTVTSEGWLNVKDGNGDLMTEGEWDDFVLQLDILSNGDHLNSGVFFRCIPGEFWSGYEAQIRNEWITDVQLKDGTTVSGSFTDKGDTVAVQVCTKANAEGTNWRPTREVKTFKKDDIDQVIHRRDKPVDIGTGGLYNRQPARKVVSSDREWFTMTVVAHGLHMATWVNGYQVTDFTDTAPVGDNARKGAKTIPGPISLQGHDPTTDLSFRNIRLAPLPKKE